MSKSEDSEKNTVQPVLIDRYKARKLISDVLFRMANSKPEHEFWFYKGYYIRYGRIELELHEALDNSEIKDSGDINGLVSKA